MSYVSAADVIEQAYLDAYEEATNPYGMEKSAGLRSAAAKLFRRKPKVMAIKPTVKPQQSTGVFGMSDKAKSSKGFSLGGRTGGYLTVGAAGGYMAKPYVDRAGAAIKDEYIQRRNKKASYASIEKEAGLRSFASGLIGKLRGKGKVPTLSPGAASQGAHASIRPSGKTVVPPSFGGPTNTGRMHGPALPGNYTGRMHGPGSADAARMAKLNNIKAGMSPSLGADDMAKRVKLNKIKRQMDPSLGADDMAKKIAANKAMRASKGIVSGL